MVAIVPSFAVSRLLMPFAYLPGYRFRLDHDGYLRCWELLRQADIEFIEWTRSAQNIGTSQQLETTVDGQLRSKSGIATCYLRAFGKHFRLVVLVVGDPPPPIVDEVRVALGKHVLGRYNSFNL